MTPERLAKLRAALLRRQPDLTVLADWVNKPHNISAILRSADAVGIHRIHAISASGAIRRHHMIAGGAKRYVEIALHPTIDAALDTLEHEGWTLVAAHSGSPAHDFREVDYTAKVAIALGAELQGPSPATMERADIRVRIPMQGLGSSLNVSVAAGVILLEAERQRMAAGLYDRSRLEPEEFKRTLFEWAYPDIAERCRELGRPYPALTEDGLLASNPFAAPG